jgi:hypothetical protein
MLGPAVAVRWAIGAVVVLIGAALLPAIIGVARRITRQADGITKALDGAHTHTDAWRGGQAAGSD